MRRARAPCACKRFKNITAHPFSNPQTHKQQLLINSSHLFPSPLSGSPLKAPPPQTLPLLAIGLPLDDPAADEHATWAFTLLPAQCLADRVHLRRTKRRVKGC